MIDFEELVKKLIAGKSLTEQEARQTAEMIAGKLNAAQKMIRENVAAARSAQAKNEARDDFSYTDRVYTDEPLGTRPRRTDNDQTEGYERRYEPYKSEQQIAIERINAMRRIAAKPENRGKTPEEIFCLQSNFMLDFEDDYMTRGVGLSNYRTGKYDRYFTSFQEMSVHGLRSYFSWRTRLRKGKLEYTSLEFALIRSAELLNMIGCASAEEAYEELKAFIEAYSKLDARLSYFSKQWLKDFVIAHGLDKRLLASLPELKYSKEFCILLEPEDPDDKTVFDALNVFSAYKANRSRMYKLYPEDFTAICARVWRELLKTNDCSEAFREKYIGVKTKTPYDLFGVMPVDRRKLGSSMVYDIDPYCRYLCENGRWYHERLVRTGSNSIVIGALLKNTDYLMRKQYKLKSTLQPDALDADDAQLINSVIAGFLREKREKEKPKVELDLSKLESIRVSSLETQELLLVPTEEDAVSDIKEENEEAKSPESVSANEQSEKEETVPAVELTEAERLLLSCLIEKTPYQAKLHEIGVLPSVAADSINEKLFDLIGDMAITDNGSGLEVIEDYMDDLKGLI